MTAPSPERSQEMRLEYEIELRLRQQFARKNEARMTELQRIIAEERE